MQRNTRLMVSAAAIAALSLCAGPALAQKGSASGHSGAPQDWSNSRVIYANPDTPDEAARKHATARWLRNAQDPRFLVALARKINAQEHPNGIAAARPLAKSLNRDWNVPLGGTGGTGTPGVFPAKYSFDITAAPSCANDFVVYTTATAGLSQNTTTGTQETWTVQFTGNHDPQTTGSITFNAGAQSLTAGTNFLAGTGGGSGLAARALRIKTTANNLAAAAQAISGTTGITASSDNVSTVTFTHVAVGNVANNVLTDSLTFTTDVKIDGTDPVTTPGQATLVAFSNLYKTTCSGTVPGVFFAVNTGTGAVTRTSPSISYLDGGKQVAFVQTNSSNQAQLVLLKWSSATPGTVTNPTTPTLVSLASYRGCTAPCMAVTTLSGNPNDLYSSPYVDYIGDVIWIGDAAGKLHKFTGVFQGTPAEVTTGGFPATVSANNALSSPVFDFGGNQVYVGSTSGAVTGGALHRINPSTGAVVSSAKLAIASSTGLRDSPIIDSNAGRVYAFVYDDGKAGDVTHCDVVAGNNNGCRGVFQFTTGFAAANAGLETFVGRGNSLTNTLYDPTFDNAYYNSVNSTGALYIVGGAVLDTFTPTLWKIPITNNVMGTAVAGPAVGSSDGGVGIVNQSPVSEVPNGTNDYLYFSLPSNGTANGLTASCTGACIYMYNLSDLNGTLAGTGAAWGTTNRASASLAATGGTGGVVMDNVSTATGASQIYFSTLVNPGKAYQASQSGLQ